MYLLLTDGRRERADVDVVGADGVLGDDAETLSRFEHPARDRGAGQAPGGGDRRAAGGNPRRPGRAGARAGRGAAGRLCRHD